MAVFSGTNMLTVNLFFGGGWDYGSVGLNKIDSCFSSFFDLFIEAEP